MYVITQDKIDSFCRFMYESEKSDRTIIKYKSDIMAFMAFLSGKEEFEKADVVAYKAYLKENYKLSSTNSKIAALNTFFKYHGYNECVVKTFKRQQQTFRSSSIQLSKEEYFILLEKARKRSDQRLFYILETIASTGIRIGELSAITVEAVTKGSAEIEKKGKTRVILIPDSLRRELLAYIEQKGIHSGPIFITKSGMTVDRTNVLHDMKRLCKDTDIDPAKVYPHNLRHLFALTYYKQEKDIIHLADILGHSSINTTRIYTMSDSEEESSKMDRLGLMYKGV